MALTIRTVYTTGKNLFATLQRLSDNFYWNEDTGAWAASPSIDDKKIVLTEGTGEYLNTYVGSNSGDLGNALEVLVRIHDDDNVDDESIAEEKTYIVGGNEYSNLLPVYHAQVTLNRVSGGDDKYSVHFFKDGLLLTSGITSPTIQVIERDGSDLVASTALNPVGSTGLFIYDEPTNLISAGESYDVRVSATIDGVSRTWPSILWRDA